MRIFFDTEFTGLHKNTTLISIGLIDEDDNMFYAELNDYDESLCDDWINENVIKHLMFNEYSTHMEVNGRNVKMKGSKSYVADCLKIWLSDYDSIQLVSDVCHYDMVLFIDLFGTAFDLPKGVNASCHDINQDISEYYNISEAEAFDKSREEMLDQFHVVIDGDKHNSLYDAKVIKELYYYLG